MMITGIVRPVYRNRRLRRRRRLRILLLILLLKGERGSVCRMMIIGIVLQESRSPPHLLLRMTTLRLLRILHLEESAHRTVTTGTVPRESKNPQRLLQQMRKQRQTHLRSVSHTTTIGTVPKASKSHLSRRLRQPLTPPCSRVVLVRWEF
ncbi:hypothetical protein BJX65DRAFT_260448 [Aspergillus insuetus]